MLNVCGTNTVHRSAGHRINLFIHMGRVVKGFDSYLFVRYIVPNT
jgi:hypothetical protein